MGMFVLPQATACDVILGELACWGIEFVRHLAFAQNRAKRTMLRYFLKLDYLKYVGY